VLIAPAFRFLDRRWNLLSEFERRYWKEAGWIRYKNDSIDVEVGYGLMEERMLYLSEALAERWTKPALIYHGTADDTVPYGDSVDFLQKASGGRIELRLFKNGDHRLTEYKDEIAAEACRFLATGCS
jgi:pimeloyl-ACP methyl ester carboxylesterase